MSKNAGADGMDMLSTWRDWFIQSERRWSEELAGMMKQNAVAQTIGKEINAALHGQEMLTQGMAASLAMFNMPTRDDILALGERLGRLEDSVARQEASLVRLQNAALAESHGPPRTRQADVISTEHGGAKDPNAAE
jgi:hypothetical protein